MSDEWPKSGGVLPHDHLERPQGAAMSEPKPLTESREKLLRSPAGWQMCGPADLDELLATIDSLRARCERAEALLGDLLSERDAALARVAELERGDIFIGTLDAARAEVKRLRAISDVRMFNLGADLAKAGKPYPDEDAWADEHPVRSFEDQEHAWTEALCMGWLWFHADELVKARAEAAALRERMESMTTLCPCPDCPQQIPDGWDDCPFCLMRALEEEAAGLRAERDDAWEREACMGDILCAVLPQGHRGDDMSHAEQAAALIRSLRDELAAAQAERDALRMLADKREALWEGAASQLAAARGVVEAARRLRQAEQAAETELNAGRGSGYDADGLRSLESDLDAALARYTATTETTR